jgi:hypothetical protein
VPFSTVRQDIIDVILANPPDPSEIIEPNAGVRFTTVLGSEVAVLSMPDDESVVLDNVLPADQKVWVDMVIQLYPPSTRQRVVQGMLAALQNGNLIVEDNAATRYRLTLSKDFYGTGVEDFHRAAAARAMDVDLPLYTNDLDIIVRNRTGDRDLGTYIEDVVIPLLPNWQNSSAVRTELNATAEASRLLISRHVKPQQMWLYNHRLLAIESPQAAQLLGMALDDRPRPNWVSHAVLLESFGGDSRRLMQARRATFSNGERPQLARNVDDRQLDVYYSPGVADRIKAAV